MMISFGGRMASLFHGFVTTFENIGFTRELAAVRVDTQIVAGINDKNALVAVFLGGDNGSPVHLEGFDDGWNAAKTGHGYLLL
jgi:hypothetical protein